MNPSFREALDLRAFFERETSCPAPLLPHMTFETLLDLLCESRKAPADLFLMVLRRVELTTYAQGKKSRLVLDVTDGRNSGRVVVFADAGDYVLSWLQEGSMFAVRGGRCDTYRGEKKATAFANAVFVNVERVLHTKAQELLQLHNALQGAAPPPVPVECSPIADIMQAAVGSWVNIMGVTQHDSLRGTTLDGAKATCRTRLADGSCRGTSGVDIKIVADGYCEITVPAGTPVRAQACVNETQSGRRWLQCSLSVVELGASDGHALALQESMALSCSSASGPLQPFEFGTLQQLAECGDGSADVIVIVLRTITEPTPYGDGVQVWSRLEVTDGYHRSEVTVFAVAEDGVLSRLQQHGMVGVISGAKASQRGGKWSLSVSAGGVDVFVGELPEAQQLRKRHGEWGTALPPPLPLKATKIGKLMTVDVGSAVHVMGIVIYVGPMEATRFGDKSTRRLRIADTSNKSVGLKLYASELCDIGTTEGMVIRCGVAEVEELNGVKTLKAFMSDVELDVRDDAAHLLRAHFANASQPTSRWSQVTPLRPALVFRPASEILDDRSTQVDVLFEILEMGATEHSLTAGNVRMKSVVRCLSSLGDGGSLPFVVLAKEADPVLSLLRPNAKVAVRGAFKYVFRGEQQVRAYGENVFLEDEASPESENPLRGGLTDGSGDEKTDRSANGTDCSADETDYGTDGSDRSHTNGSMATSESSFVVSDNASLYYGSESDGALREQQLDRPNAKKQREERKREKQLETLQEMKKALDDSDTMLTAADVTNTLSSGCKEEEVSKYIDSASSYLKKAKRMCRLLNKSIDWRKRLLSEESDDSEESDEKDDGAGELTEVETGGRRRRRRVCVSDSEEVEEVVDMLPVGDATAITKAGTHRRSEWRGRLRPADSRSCQLGVEKDSTRTPHENPELVLNPYGSMENVCFFQGENDASAEGQTKAVRDVVRRAPLVVECSIQATKETADAGEGPRTGKLAFPCLRKFAVTVCCASSSRMRWNCVRSAACDGT